MIIKKGQIVVLQEWQDHENTYCSNGVFIAKKEFNFSSYRNIWLTMATKPLSKSTGDRALRKGVKSFEDYLVSNGAIEKIEPVVMYKNSETEYEIEGAE